LILAVEAAESSLVAETAFSAFNFGVTNLGEIAGGIGLTAATVGGLSVGLAADRRREKRFQKTDTTPAKSRQGPQSISATKRPKAIEPDAWDPYHIDEEDVVGFLYQVPIRRAKIWHARGHTRGRGRRTRRKRYRYRYRV